MNFIAFNHNLIRDNGQEPFIFTHFNNELSSLEYLEFFNNFYFFDNTQEINDILKTILYNAYWYKKEDLFRILTKDFSKKENADKERLATLLPGNSMGWQVAYSLGDSIAQFYWENNIFIPRAFPKIVANIFCKYSFLAFNLF